MALPFLRGRGACPYPRGEVVTELETLIDQQRREMRRPWRVFHWSHRSVAAPLSLDFDLSRAADDSHRLADVLVEGVNAWLPWHFAPADKPSNEERFLFIAENLTGAERALYAAEWGGGE